ncbi:hypothetical protein D3C75_1124000 [compost metagenome]
MLEEISYNNVAPELNPEAIINRMGLDIVRDEHLIAQRQRPLGISESAGAFQ